MNYRKIIICTAIICTLLSTVVFARAFDNKSNISRNTGLETVTQQRQRHNAERYEQYRTNNFSTPLGGYREKYGDVAPCGTVNPGTGYSKCY